MPVDLEGKPLRVLQEKEVKPVARRSESFFPSTWLRGQTAIWKGQYALADLDKTYFSGSTRCRTSSLRDGSPGLIPSC